ncbi:MAG: hypothetical protein QM572_16000 [Nocardioides sp.]|uniref:hypothetical protein n=1 Tax=Nocardioides sp. TaxID=35761 RepID=UPI0039E4CB49
MFRPRRRWWIAGACLLAALAVALLVRPGAYVAEPRTTTLPQARVDLADAAFADWLAERASDPGLAALRITALDSDVVAQSGAMQTDGTWTASASVTWQYAGADPSPATVDLTVGLRTSGEDGDHVSVTGVTGPGRVPLWLAGPLTVTRTATTLVATGSGIDHAAYAGWAAEAVRVVRRVIPDWNGPLVVEVPASSAALDATLAADDGTYANIAAVTASVDGSSRADSPVHVFVNPEVMSGLVASSAQIVLSHEATHAATGAVLTRSRPIWLTEGFADYVALRDVDVPLSTSAGQIAAVVRKDGVPGHLPDEDDFDASSDRFGAEYEAAWLAVVQLADDAGEGALVRFYDDVGAGAALGKAMRADIGYGVGTLTRKWQRRLSGLANQS